MTKKEVMTRILEEGKKVFENTGKIFVTEREIIYPYTGLFCITAMMRQLRHRFDGTMKGLKDFMVANEHYFNKKGR